MASEWQINRLPGLLAIKMIREQISFAKLPSTVIIQTGYQKGEGYAKNIPAFRQVLQLYKSNILSDYWKQNRCFYLAQILFNISLNSITNYSHLTHYTCYWLVIQVFKLGYHTSISHYSLFWLVYHTILYSD